MPSFTTQLPSIRIASHGNENFPGRIRMSPGTRRWDSSCCKPVQEQSFHEDLTFSCLHVLTSLSRTTLPVHLLKLLPTQLKIGREPRLGNGSPGYNKSLAPQKNLILSLVPSQCPAHIGQWKRVVWPPCAFIGRCPGSLQHIVSH